MPLALEVQRPPAGHEYGTQAAVQLVEGGGRAAQPEGAHPAWSWRRQHARHGTADRRAADTGRSQRRTDPAKRYWHTPKWIMHVTCVPASTQSARNAMVVPSSPRASSQPTPYLNPQHHGGAQSPQLTHAANPPHHGGAQQEGQLVPQQQPRGAHGAAEQPHAQQSGNELRTYDTQQGTYGRCGLGSRVPSNSRVPQAGTAC